MQPSPARLPAHRLFHGTRLREALEFLWGHHFDLRPDTRDRTPLDVRINGVQLQDLFLGDVSYGRAIEVAATPARTDYWLHLPRQHDFELEIGRRRMCCNVRTGAVITPQQRTLIRTSPACARFVLSLPRDPLVRMLSALLDQPLGAPLEFAPAVNLTQGYGQSLVRHVRNAVDDLEGGGSLLNHPVARSGFEQFVMMGLLLSHGHNYSAALLKPTPAVASRDVRRAIDFIEAHLDVPISMADIIGAAAVSGRALFRDFKRFTGQSPMQYLRDARFRRVRSALARAEPGQRVSEIAAQWGFVHLGRFSRDYRQRFGEPPSVTLRHARI
jgi:AraC-like DNA-binding protein